jgi:hypothetical protein
MAKENEKLKPLLFKDFKLELLSFELRYEYEKFYLYNLRPFWREIHTHLKGEFSPVEQGEQSVINYNDKFEIQISPDRFAIVEFYPNRLLTDFLEISRIFFEAAVKVLELEEITRTGLRLIYSKEFQDPIAVAEALYNTPYINVPNDLYLSGNGTPLIPNYAIGWKDEEKGITYRLNGKSGKLGIDLPLQMIAAGQQPTHIEKVFNQVNLDVDIYVHKAVSPGQFFPVEWIRQAYKTGHNEGEKFFGEK